MMWSSWQAFIDMGGSGPFVWGSYGLSVVLLVVEVILLKKRAAALRTRLARRRPGKEIAA
ncbi:MAG: heme exporter protein CcmD [Rhodocyclaceae bacterium]|nr:heme exporter protein CcmD [Rhodocyclaceae bacterium]